MSAQSIRQEIADKRKYERIGAIAKRDGSVTYMTDRGYVVEVYPSGEYEFIIYSNSYFRTIDGWDSHCFTDYVKKGESIADYLAPDVIERIYASEYHARRALGFIADYDPR